MAKTGIFTSQYVHIELPTASLGDRILAQLVDWLVMLIYSVAIIWSLENLNLTNYRLVMLLWFLPIMFYTPVCEMLFQGQTLGKMALRTRVVTIDGRQPALSAILLRWILWIIDGPTFSFLGLLVMAVGRDNQRLGDLAAGTVVVKQQDYHAIQVSLDDYDYLAHGYTPRYPQAADLSLEQVEVISRTLSTSTADQTQRLALLAEKVRQKFNITPDEPSPALFLQRILRDYQYYALEEI